MAVKDTKAKGGKRGASLDPDDAVVGGGLFGAGYAVAKKHRFGMFDYNGTRKAVPALLVTFTRDGERHIESYTVGQGWRPSEDGLRIIPKQGQTGLNDNCKAMKYITALRDECGMPKGTMGDDVSVLDGIAGTLARQTLEKVEGSDKAGTVLIFEDLDVAPWLKGKKASKKAKDEDADEDDDGDEDEDEGEDESEDEDEDESEDEDDSNNDDEDEDESPRRKSQSKSSKSSKGSSAKGKNKKADGDDDDSGDDDGDGDDEDLTEEAVEALIFALEDGNLKQSKIEGAVRGVARKNPNSKAIAALAASDSFLKQQRGWRFDRKTKIASLK